MAKEVEVVLVENYTKIDSFKHDGGVSIHDYVTAAKKIGPFDFLVIDNGRLVVYELGEKKLFVFGDLNKIKDPKGDEPYKKTYMLVNDGMCIHLDEVDAISTKGGPTYTFDDDKKKMTYIQYSTDGEYWFYIYKAGSKYIRFSFDGCVHWTEPMQFAEDEKCIHCMTDALKLSEYTFKYCPECGRKVV